MKRLLPFGAILLLALPASADSPTLSRITPSGGRRGTELEVTFSGSRLKDAVEIFFYRPGIEVAAFEPKSDAALKVRLRIAPDAPMGEHPMRVRTASGISELRVFRVGPFAAVAEKEPNSEFDAPQPVDLNVTVEGVITGEDVDYYSVTVRKGQRISAEVEGIRLGITLFDPYVAILDAKRFELAASDDSPLLLQDPVTSIIAPEDGTYIIQVRETSYGGNDNCRYRLHLGTFPRPLVAYPPGGRTGEELTVTMLGDPAGPYERKVKLPGEPVRRFEIFAERDGQVPPSPNYLSVGAFPNVLEQEPNNGRDQATATDLPLPVAFNGIIGGEGDDDWFRFTAKKGRQFDVTLEARSLRSPLDAVMYVYDAKGNRLGADDDDGRHPDPRIRFRAPADGDYFVRVRDHLRRGGPLCVYRVEFREVKPSVYTHIPAYSREPRGQRRQWVVVPRGNRFTTWIRVNRDNFGGDMNLEFKGLPEGITVHADPIHASVDRVPVVFEAAPDAKIAGTLVEVIARHADPKQKIAGGFRQDVNLVFGQPNNTTYYATRVDRLGVAVAEEVPFRIRVEQPKAPLVRNGSMAMKVIAEREKGFDKEIRIRLLWKPPGVSASSSVKLEGNKTEILYPFNANDKAALRDWKISFLAYADTGHGYGYAASQPVTLTIAEPWVAMKIDMAAAEQGKPADVVCTIDQRRPFEGRARVVLHGLPAGVENGRPEIEITKDDKEVVFPLKVGAKSPKGQHKSLFCQIFVPDQGEEVCHRVGGGGTLRIDPPPPAPKKPVAKGKAAPKKEEKKPEKRLSRLEQLRLQAKQKAASGGKE